jgi:CrcB protein
LLRAAAERERNVRVVLMLVAFGSAGTLARYWLQGWVQFRSGAGFPTGTLAVNLLGCFLLGAIGQYSLNHLSVPPEWRVAITIGFLGAFTTFSTFGWETVQMLHDGEWGKVLLYMGSSVLGGVLAVMLGMRLGNSL